MSKVFSAPTTQFVTFDSVKKGQHEAGLEGAKFGDRPSFIIEVSQSNAESILKISHNLFIESLNYFPHDDSRHSSERGTVWSQSDCVHVPRRTTFKFRENVDLTSVSVWNCQFGTYFECAVNFIYQSFYMVEK